MTLRHGSIYTCAGEVFIITSDLCTCRGANMGGNIHQHYYRFAGGSPWQKPYGAFTTNSERATTSVLVSVAG